MSYDPGAALHSAICQRCPEESNTTTLRQPGPHGVVEQCREPEVLDLQRRPGSAGIFGRSFLPTRGSMVYPEHPGGGLQEGWPYLGIRSSVS